MGTGSSTRGKAKAAQALRHSTSNPTKSALAQPAASRASTSEFSQAAADDVSEPQPEEELVGRHRDPDPPELRGDEGTCPQGHDLEAYIADEDDWFCSACDEGFGVGERMWSCRMCDFDLCQICFSPEAERPVMANSMQLRVLGPGGQEQGDAVEAELESENAKLRQELEELKAAKAKARLRQRGEPTDMERIAAAIKIQAVVRGMFVRKKSSVSHKPSEPKAYPKSRNIEALFKALQLTVSFPERTMRQSRVIGDNMVVEEDVMVRADGVAVPLSPRSRLAMQKGSLSPLPLVSPQPSLTPSENAMPSTARSEASVKSTKSVKSVKSMKSVKSLIPALPTSGISSEQPSQMSVGSKAAQPEETPVEVGEDAQSRQGMASPGGEAEEPDFKVGDKVTTAHGPDKDGPWRDMGLGTIVGMGSKPGWLNIVFERSGESYMIKASNLSYPKKRRKKDDFGEDAYKDSTRFNIREPLGGLTVGDHVIFGGGRGIVVREGTSNGTVLIKLGGLGIRSVEVSKVVKVQGEKAAIADVAGKVDRDKQAFELSLDEAMDDFKNHYARAKAKMQGEVYEEKEEQPEPTDVGNTDGRLKVGDMVKVSGSGPWGNMGHGKITGNGEKEGTVMVQFDKAGDSWCLSADRLTRVVEKHSRKKKKDKHHHH